MDSHGWALLSEFSSVTWQRNVMVFPRPATTQDTMLNQAVQQLR
jgi:hypothetical protein